MTLRRASYRQGVGKEDFRDTSSHSGVGCKIQELRTLALDFHLSVREVITGSHCPEDGKFRTIHEEK